MTSFKMAQKMQTLDEKMSKLVTLKPQGTQDYELRSANTKMAYRVFLAQRMVTRPPSGDEHVDSGYEREVPEN